MLFRFGGGSLPVRQSWLIGSFSGMAMFDGLTIWPFSTFARTLKKPRTSPGFPLRSVAIVIVDDPTQHVATAHRPIDLATCLGDGDLLIDALVGARGVEELNIVTHYTP
jgi:hypothetical protein